MNAEDWLEEKFLDEPCPQCQGDACHHTAIEVNGEWSAICSYPPDKDTGKLHPIIANFRHLPQ